MIDRISMLPDEILCHILSFLSTQKVIDTSVLSKRWKHLWTSVPALDYDEQIYHRRGTTEKPSTSFEKFVYTTIQARDVHQPIRSFVLKYYAYDCTNAHVDINPWLKDVLPRGLENLDILKYFNHPMVSLSCCIFRCTTLVTLKLTRLSLNVSSIELPSLKSLHLVHVEFARHRYLQDLLCGCPILEDLIAHCINYAHEGSFCEEEFKSLPKLVRADLRFRTDIPLKAISNVEFLCMAKYQLAIVVPEFPNLMHMVINRVSWDLVLEMLKNCPMLQVLEVVSWDCPGADEFFSYPHFVPECLTSQFRKCSFKYYYGTEIELRFAKYIMQSSTTLQTMTICSRPFLSPEAKYKMLNELALCPRRSALCQLSFNDKC